jgi:hypothetical protein
MYRKFFKLYLKTFGQQFMCIPTCEVKSDIKPRLQSKRNRDDADNADFCSNFIQFEMHVVSARCVAAIK